MGTSSSTAYENRYSNVIHFPTPNVKERHSRALYINIPISHEHIEKLLGFNCIPDKYNDICWISIVVDDLDRLEIYGPLSGHFYYSGLCGWMCKTNLLVKRSVPDFNGSSWNVSGYQILTLDFESGIGGLIKSLGAKATQKIPTYLSRFITTVGKSGQSSNSILNDKDSYRCNMDDLERLNLISVKGKFDKNVSKEMRKFMSFVVNRPHKFLKQVGNDVVLYHEPLHNNWHVSTAYSPEIGTGAEFNHEDCLLIDIEELSLPILNRFKNDGINYDLIQHIDFNKCICFIQPQYILIDHQNVILK